MASTILQIRRSNTASTPTTTLNSGELAYSYNSNNLFIGAQSGVGSSSLLIGGIKYNFLNNAGLPGVQTANATVILDANSFTTNTFTQGLVLQGSGTITAPFINSISNNGTTYLGSNAAGGGSGNELVTSAAVVTYVLAHSGAAGIGSATNTELLFADGTSVNGSLGFTFTKTSNTLFLSNVFSVGNSSLVASPYITIQNTSSQANLTSTTLTIGTTIANTSGFYANLLSANAFSSPNFSANSTLVNAAALNVVNQINTATLYATTSANIASAVQANSSGVFTTGTVNATSFSSGPTFTANSTLVNAAAINISGQVNTATLYASGSANIASSVLANSLGVFTTGVVNATTISTGTGTTINSSGLYAQTASIGNSTTNSVFVYNATDLSIAEMAGNSNNFLEVVVWNANTGNNASADFIVNDTNGPAATNYNFIDLGINGNGFNQPTTWTISGPSDGYLYTGNTNLSIGTLGVNWINFFTGNTFAANERMRIAANGNIGIGNITPNNTLSVTGNVYVGDVTGNIVANSSGVYTTGTVNALTMNATTFNAGLNTTINATGVYAQTASFGNVVINTTASLTANGVAGNPGQSLVSNGSAVYWGNPTPPVPNVRSTAINTAITATDSFIIGTAAITANLPLISAVGGGKQYFIQLNGTGPITLLANGTDTIMGGSNLVIQYSGSLASIMSTNTTTAASNNWIIF